MEILFDVPPRRPPLKIAPPLTSGGRSERERGTRHAPLPSKKKRWEILSFHESLATGEISFIGDVKCGPNVSMATNADSLSLV